MSYDNNIINQPNMNTPGQNALRDNQVGTINVSKSDVTKNALGSTKNQLRNDNAGMTNGDTVDSSYSENPVSAEFASPQQQVNLQNPGQKFAYPARSNQGPGY